MRRSPLKDYNHVVAAHQNQFARLSHNIRPRDITHPFQFIIKYDGRD